MSDDLKVSQRYRELGTEEPPRALDDAILAASRRQTGFPARPWTRRWAVPLSLAAVVVLSVTVTLRIQHEQPGIEVPAPQAKQTAPATSAPPAPAAEAQPRVKQERPRKPVARREPGPFPPAAQDRLAADKASVAAPAPAAAPAAAAQMQTQRAKAVTDTPERELERIAGLRHLGMHGEADKALAEFHRRFPDYDIPEAMRARVERR
ncbi:MAG TPA: hypothetical protein VKS43_08395 [Burkholderiales bacterium]|nr:hypothetical protein [Burkholderiales bacterium]